MVSPVGSPGVTPTPAKKVEPKKEEAKTENQSPQKPVEPPRAGNAGEAKREEPTAFTGALDPKTAFTVTQTLQKRGSVNGGGGSPAAPDAQADGLQDAIGDYVNPGGQEKPKEPGDGGDSNMGSGMGTGVPDKPGDKPEEPPKMTTRRALDILMDDGNKGLDKLDVAKDKIKKGKDNPKGDHKVSTEDLDLALGKEGYLTKEEAEAAKHLRDSGAWDEINGKDSKATFDEITDYRNNRTSPDKEGDRRPEGNGSSDIKSDGKIDKVEQGGTGDCWWLAGINAVNNTEEGKKDIKDSIKQNDDGSFSVKFKGDASGKDYTVTEEMIRKNKNSKGDDDAKILEEAARQYYNDNPTGDDGVSPIIDGGQPSEAIRLLTGKEGNTDSANGFDALDAGRDKAKNIGKDEKDQVKTDRDGKISTKDLKAAVENDGIVNDEEKEAAKTLLNSDAWDEINGKDDKATVEEIRDYAKKHGDTDVAKAIETLSGNSYKEKEQWIEEFKKNPDKSALTFSAPGDDAAHTGAGKNGHAFTVLGIDGDTVTYVNPWNNQKKRTMSVDELMNTDTMYFTKL